jgi:hypothetical protein
MFLKSVNDALSVFEYSSNPFQREEAKRFILAMDQDTSIPILIGALQNDHFGVRWEAAEILARIGCPAMVEILKVLVNPVRVGDPRLREGVLHVFRDNHDPFVREVSAHLQNALHGPVPDLETMREANLLLQEIVQCS